MTSREQFEAWFKSDFHPDKTGPYLKETLYFAWQAASKASEQQLAAVVAENAGLKSKGREVLKEANYVYSHYNRMVEHLDGESIDGQTLHEFQVAIEAETPATDAAIAKIQAQGVEMLLASLPPHYTARADIESFAAQLRQGAEHE